MEKVNLTSTLVDLYLLCMFAQSSTIWKTARQQKYIVKALKLGVAGLFAVVCATANMNWLKLENEGDVIIKF